MSNTPEGSAEEMNAEPTPTYLLEPFITEDGITVPPPTRPMGPRRLARYYDEVAEYLRAVQRGDEELPDRPHSMGSLERQSGDAPTQSLASLSMMGNIDTSSGKDAEDFELGFDEGRATVLEDPLGYVGEQVFASHYEHPADTRPDIDFAAATGEISGLSGFISLDTLVDSDSDNSGEGYAVPETEEQEPSANSAADQESEKTGQQYVITKNDEAIAAILARAKQREEAARAETVEGYALGEESKNENDEPGEGAETTSTVAVDGITSNLPARVPAVEAQGLDLSELDEPQIADVTDPADPDATEVWSAIVDSDSSGDSTAQEAAVETPDVNEENKIPDLPHSTPETSDLDGGGKPRGNGASTVLMVIVALLVLLLVLWFLFFQ